jgi:hypothetical protein
MSETFDLQNFYNLWPRVKDAFAWDGSWRDIYVVGTNEKDWNRLLDELRKPHYRPRFIRGDEKQNEIPANFKSIRESSTITLIIAIDGVNFDTHFFKEENIEFNIDSRQINASSFPALCNFLVMLSKVTGKECLLTDENWINFTDVKPILKVNATKDLVILVDLARRAD